MKMRLWKWIAALAVSLSLHAGATAYVMQRTSKVDIAGGGSTEIAIAGNAFAEMVAAGEATDEIQPEVEPEAEPLQPETAHEVIPEMPAETAAPVPVEILPENDTSPVVEPEQPVGETARVETPQTVEPVENAQVVTALAEAPIPTPRPAYTPPPRPKVQKTGQSRKTRATPPKKRSLGSRGHDKQDARRGTASGTKKASLAAKGKKVAEASKSGNARVSNYPGKVDSKLRRSLRYPGAAKRQRLEGEVRVHFTVARNGSVSGIRIVRSSGSKILDKAALDTVRRAAPFPPIPKEAGRASWGFIVPLEFRR